MFSSQESGWRTPKIIYEPLVQEFNIKIDAAATAKSRIVGTWFGPGSAWFEDALWADWTISSYWLNPPWSRGGKYQMKDWVRRASAEGAMGSTVVALLPARVDTSWWHDFVMDRAEVRIVRGRVTFDDPETGLPAKSAAPFPVCICIWRPGGPTTVSSMDPYGRGKK